MAASCQLPPSQPPVKEELAIGPFPATPQPKTAVSELMELAVQMGFTVNFEVVSETGQAHNKNFTINCTASDFSGIGSAASKKKAKQAAAQATLQKLKESSAFKDHLFSTSSKAALAPHMNSVGRLQEVTMKKGWQSPQYTFLADEGPPHMRQFQTDVLVGTLKASGKGKNKKEAKRTAASAMLDNLLHSNLSLQPPAKKIAFTPAVGYQNKQPYSFQGAGYY